MLATYDNVIIDAMEAIGKSANKHLLPQILMALIKNVSQCELEKIIHQAGNVIHELCKQEIGKFNEVVSYIASRDICDSIFKEGRDHENRFAIYYALRKNNKELTNLFLDKKVPLENVDGQGNHAIHVCYDKPDMLHFLLQKNPDWINIQNVDGESVCFLLAKKDNKEELLLLQSLLKYQPDLKKRDRNHKTIMHYVAKSKATWLISDLLNQCNSQPCLFSLEDENGDLPLQYNMENCNEIFCTRKECWSQQIKILLKNKKVLDYLKEDNVNGRKWIGFFTNTKGPKTVLELASEMDSWEIVQMLLNWGLTSGFKDSLKIACQNWYDRLIKVFLSHKKLCFKIEFDESDFCVFLVSANKKGKSALDLLQLKLPERKIDFIAMLKKNLTFSAKDCAKEDTFLKLVHLNDKELTQMVLKLLSKDEKGVIGRKALLECLLKRDLSSVIPLISDNDVPLVKVEDTSIYSKVKALLFCFAE